MFRLRFRIAEVSFFVFFSLLLSSRAFALGSDNSKAYAHYMTGVVLDHADQTEAALQEFEQAKRYDPKADLVNLRIAIDYIKLGNNKRAVEELNSTLELNPDNLQARTLLAFLYTAGGEFTLAEIQYEIILKQAVQEDPENLDVHNYLGQLYFQQKKFDKALEQFQFILSKDPKNSLAKLFAGLTFEEQGMRLKAIKEFKEILAFEPDNPDVLNALGYTYAEVGENLDEAEKLINKAIEKQPKNGAYIDSLGWVYFKKGNLDKAREKLEEAVAIVEDPLIFDHLAQVYLKIGDSNKAKEAWQKALKLKPNDEKLVNEINNNIKQLK